MKTTIEFENLVNIALENIKDAYENHNGWDWKQDFMDDINYSEICEWCNFPDLGTNESIYEKAIDMAIMILSHNYTNNYNICEFMCESSKRYMWG